MSRSGATVTFEGSDGTILKLPATKQAQTIIFSDLSKALKIDNSKIYLDSLLITTISQYVTEPASFTTFLTRKNPKQYQMTAKYTITTNSSTVTEAVVVFPLPQSNIYQDISNVSYNDFSVFDIPNSDDNYIRYIDYHIVLSDTIKSWNYTYEVTLYDIEADLDSITIEYPYDTRSNEYKWNTGTNGQFIDPYNSEIQSIANYYWGLSSSIMEYARYCYQYVSDNYTYQNANTGLYPLSQILSEDGGDCGNLTSIFVSLLRNKNIPARHLVSVRLSCLKR